MKTKELPILPGNYSAVIVDYPSIEDFMVRAFPGSSLSVITDSSSYELTTIRIPVKVSESNVAEVSNNLKLKIEYELSKRCLNNVVECAKEEFMRGLGVDDYEFSEREIDALKKTELKLQVFTLKYLEKPNDDIHTLGKSKLSVVFVPNPILLTVLKDRTQFYALKLREFLDQLVQKTFDNEKTSYSIVRGYFEIKARSPENITSIILRGRDILASPLLKAALANIDDDEITECARSVVSPFTEDLLEKVSNQKLECALRPKACKIEKTYDDLVFKLNIDACGNYSSYLKNYVFFKYCSDFLRSVDQKKDFRTYSLFPPSRKKAPLDSISD